MSGLRIQDLEPSLDGRQGTQSYLYTPTSFNDLNLNSTYARSKMGGKKSSESAGEYGDDSGFTPPVSTSVDIPVPSTPPSHPRMVEKKYWKLSFRIVLLPLMLLALPTHLVLKKRPIKNRKDWLKGLINLGNFGLTLLTVLIFTGSVALNVYVLKNIVEMFDVLVIRGELSPSVVLNLIYLLQNLPIIIPMNFIWIWGYVLRDLILSFSRPSLSDSFLQNPDLFNGSQPQLPGRLKLIIMYFLIAFIHTMHIYMYSARATQDLPDALSVVVHFLNYLIGPVFSTLILPVYATFCWACHRHYTILANYVITLINLRAIPEVIQFNHFKLAFKELSDRVQLVNRLFCIYLSWVIVNVVVSLYVEAWDLTNVFFSAMSVASVNSTELEPDEPLFPPEVVRGFVAFGFIVTLKFALLGFTFWQAVMVNDVARGLNIWLNDLVTEPHANLSVSNYHAFRLLKFYIRSRMQQPRPALLRIPIMNCIPALKHRLSPMFVDQY